MSKNSSKIKEYGYQPVKKINKPKSVYQPIEKSKVPPKLPKGNLGLEKDSCIK
ncbi:hypothetical protein [Burkholderia pseudomallei]